MQNDFSTSETKLNLLRAFSGESQAKNRYEFSAAYAHKNKLYAVASVFNYTALQEKAHAKVFYDFLKEFSGENIDICAGYPIDNYDNIEKLLEAAKHNETEEYDTIYKDFADVAKNEGFLQISAAFSNIADIEKTHADRFDVILNLIKDNKMYVSDVEEKWICLNCGYIYEGKITPTNCPVCSHEQGYFIKLELSPFA